MSIVELDHVTYSYPVGSAPALSDVDLRIEPGEVVVVAGGSGSGKSTLLRVLSGLVPHFHGGTFAGRAVVAGMDTRSHGPGELAVAVGTLFQDPEAQVVTGTVRSELAFGLENRGLARAAVARGVEEAALALAVDHLLDRSTAELSGGELQRTALGAALAGSPSLVVLDEPTSQLDPVAGDELIGLLRRANEDRDVTVVLSEHRLERCLPAADRVLALSGGRIVCDAAPERFLQWARREAPNLQTPGAALLASLGLEPVAGVRRARAALRARGLLPEPAVEPAFEPAVAVSGQSARLRRRPGRAAERALALEGVWHELRGGPAILRGVSLSLKPGERVALMGRNGAGKSTLLRHAAGLMAPSRGRVRSAGRVALLLQHPADYLVHETVAAEAPVAALAAVGLDGPAVAARNPRDLSGGERQRLALAVVLGDLTDPPAVLCLDEPTRGMDRDDRQRLVELLAGLSCAVLVATHDPELAAALATRVVLLADGAPIADGGVAEVLCGGSYFATETARILGGAGGALTPAQGAALLSGADKGAPRPIGVPA
ncbi:MAG: ABC transporter ATP-binding protein [Solirubrobacteraceae bacterium]